MTQQLYSLVYTQDKRGHVYTKTLVHTNYTENNQTKKNKRTQPPPNPNKPPKTLYSFIHNGQILDTSHRSINRGVDKQTMACLQKEILLSNTK